MSRLILLLMLLSATVAAQNITICHSTPAEKFAALAALPAFMAEHPNPRPWVHETSNDGKMITYRCPDGTSASGYFLKAKKKSDNWIFVFQEWWGLNDNIKRHAEELYTSLGNVNVLALDMYDGRLATDPKEASRLVQQFRQDRGDLIVKGALAYAGKGANIGTVGFCFGGGQSLLASLTAGKQAKACVIYYGMPVDDAERLKTLNADVLGIFAAREKRISPEVVQNFASKMKEAGKTLILKNYDAEHGFANPSNPYHDKAATEDAYKATVAFFADRLR